MTDSTWKITHNGRTYARDGITVADHSTAGIGTSRLENLARVVWTLRTAYPSKARSVTVVDETDKNVAMDTFDRMTDPEAYVGGSTNNNTRHVALNIRSWLNPWSQSKAPEKFMPMSGRTPVWEYTVTHEWGHASDPVMATDLEAKVGESVFRYLSYYGQESPEEAYAEAFAEWVLSKGRTRNVAARTYALSFHWGYPPMMQS
jgi:hypothetical protein